MLKTAKRAKIRAKAAKIAKIRLKEACFLPDP